MVGVFRRTISFPTKINPKTPPISHHIRSISLPCRPHPLISLLKHEISQIKSWSSISEPRTSAWLVDGLSRLKHVHESLDDILQLLTTQEFLRTRHVLVENLLEEFLKFVDVYGIFQTAIMSLKEQQSACQVALRKKDESKIAMYIKSRTKISKEISKLVSTTKVDRQVSTGQLLVGDAEVESVINDVVEVTVLVSVILFNGVYSAVRSRKSTSWIVGSLGFLKKSKNMKIEEGIEELKGINVESLCDLKKKGSEEVRTVLTKMRGFEGCLCEIEKGSDKVFRGLIRTRVSLLNTLTQ